MCEGIAAKRIGKNTLKVKRKGKFSDFSMKFAPTWVINMATPDQPTTRRSTWTWGRFKRKPYKKSMWIGVLWAGLRVAMWITPVGGKFRRGLLEKSQINSGYFQGIFRCFQRNFRVFSGCFQGVFRVFFPIPFAGIPF